MFPTKRPLVIIATGVVIAACASVGIAYAAGEDPTPVTGTPVMSPYQYSATVDDSEKPLSPDAAPSLISAALALKGVQDVTSATIGDPTSVDARVGNWFYPIVKVSDADRGGGILPLWESELVQGVLADSLATTDDITSGIAGAEVTGVLPDGSKISLGGGASDIRAHQVFHRSGTDAELTKTQQLATQIVQKFGLTPLSVQVLQPKDDALYVVAQIPDGTTFSHLNDLQVALNGDPLQYEGIYLEIRNSAGLRVAVTNVDYRVGAGGQWIDPSVEGTIGGPPHG